jgi:hypothetical protein
MWQALLIQRAETAWLKKDFSTSNPRLLSTVDLIPLKKFTPRVLMWIGTLASEHSLDDSCTPFAVSGVQSTEQDTKGQTPYLPVFLLGNIYSFIHNRIRTDPNVKMGVVITASIKGYSEGYLKQHEGNEDLSIDDLRVRCHPRYRRDHQWFDWITVHDNPDVPANDRRARFVTAKLLSIFEYSYSTEGEDGIRMQYNSPTLGLVWKTYVTHLSKNTLYNRSMKRHNVSSSGTTSTAVYHVVDMTDDVYERAFVLEDYPGLHEFYCHNTTPQHNVTEVLNMNECWPQSFVSH